MKLVSTALENLCHDVLALPSSPRFLCAAVTTDFTQLGRLFADPPVYGRFEMFEKSALVGLHNQAFHNHVLRHRDQVVDERVLDLAQFGCSIG
jgi:hypothetical protein